MIKEKGGVKTIGLMLALCPRCREVLNTEIVDRIDGYRDIYVVCGACGFKELGATTDTSEEGVARFLRLIKK